MSEQVKQEDGQAVEPGLWTVAQAAQYRQVSTGWLYKQVAAGLAGEPPHEIVAVAPAPGGELGELFRHEFPAHVAVAVDGEGRLWLRTGGQMLQALPSGEYRRPVEVRP